MKNENIEIIEGNKLIDDFAPEVAKQFNRFKGGCRYDLSWDFLMPVVEKIEDKYCTELTSSFDWDGEKYNKQYMFRIYRNNTRVAPKISNPNSNKIEAVWHVVVEFIKWYNQNK